MFSQKSCSIFVNALKDPFIMFLCQINVRYFEIEGPLIDFEIYPAFRMTKSVEFS